MPKPLLTVPKKSPWGIGGKPATNAQIAAALTPKPVGNVATNTGPFANIQGGVTPQNTLKPTVQPWDTQYESDVSSINSARDQSLLQIAAQRSQLGSDYGYQQDQTGAVTVDPSNPFSRAALLERTYRQSQAGSTNSLAARGQLYSGALQNALGEGQYQHDVGSDALQRSFQSAAQALEAQRLQALTGATTGITDAQGRRLDRSLTNRPDDPGTTTGAIAPLAPVPAATKPVASVKTQKATTVKKPKAKASLTQTKTSPAVLAALRKKLGL
jgi:hypothetical protein